MVIRHCAGPSSEILTAVCVVVCRTVDSTTQRAPDLVVEPGSETVLWSPLFEPRPHLVVSPVVCRIVWRWSATSSLWASPVVEHIGVDLTHLDLVTSPVVCRTVWRWSATSSRSRASPPTASSTRTSTTRGTSSCWRATTPPCPGATGSRGRARPAPASVPPRRGRRPSRRCASATSTVAPSSVSRSSTSTTATAPTRCEAPARAGRSRRRRGTVRATPAPAPPADTATCSRCGWRRRRHA